MALRVDLLTDETFRKDLLQVVRDQVRPGWSPSRAEVITLLVMGTVATIAAAALEVLK